MRKDEFLNQLAYLLQDIAEDEREEAMSYYRDYLEDAGPENEEKVVEEFGSPERVAAIIRAGVTGNLHDGASFTERGFEDERFRDPNFQIAKRLDLPEEQEEVKKEEYRSSYDSDHVHHRDTYTADYRECDTEKKPNRDNRKESERKRWAGSGWKWIVIAILLVLASPFLLGAGGVLLGVFGVAVAVVVSVILLTAAVFIVSVIVAALGIGFVLTTPLDSLFLFGLSLVGIGFGLLGVAFVAVMFGMILPFCVKGIWKGIQTLMEKGKEVS